MELDTLHPVTMPISALLVGGVHRFATCWEITRVDGTVYRFTDHNQNLVDYLGNTYLAVGTSPSSRQRAEGTAPTSAEVRGAMDAITTNAAFQAGSFRDAVVKEFVLDWRYPWVEGHFTVSTYVLTDTVFDLHKWVATIRSSKHRSAQQVGYLATRGCRWRVGDANCGIDLTAYETIDDVSAITTQRLAFTTSLAGVEHFYRDGTIEWTSGANTGVISEVKSFLSGAIELQLETPNDIQVGDDFIAIPGCNGTVEDCGTKFSNFPDRYGGYPYIPGNDEIFTIPDQPNAEDS
jgi:uncharacterized phage protein (TIGR02218 family)